MVGVKTIDEFGMILSCLRAMTEDENIDTIIALVANRPYGGEEFRAMQIKNEMALRDLGQYARKIGKPMFLVRHAMPRPRDENEELTPPVLERIPEYEKPRQAARVLGHLMRYSRYLSQH